MTDNVKLDRRTTWPAGPWDTEPDRLEFEHAGLPCLLQRGLMGDWCGYAAVPPGHPLHGKNYDEVDVEAHGGLTYSGTCSGAICHFPKPGEPDDVWWFGFSCGHAWDLIPGMLAYLTHPGLWTYRDMTYARRETEQLADQLVALGRPQ